MVEGPETEQCSLPAWLWPTLQHSHVRVGVSPNAATPAVVHGQLWVSVSPSVSPAHMVHCLAAGSLQPPVLLIWLVWLTVSLIPWLSEFLAVLFSGTSGCLLILGLLLSSFWLCEEVKGLYICLHLGWDSHFCFSFGNPKLSLFWALVPIAVFTWNSLLPGL